MPSPRSIFDAAQVAPVKSKGPKKGDKIELATPNLERYCAFDAIAKTAKTLMSTDRDGINAAILDTYLAEGERLKAKPDSYVGTDGDARATLMLNKKSTMSDLSDDAVAVLREHNIPFDEVAVGDAVETFIINPEYLGDAKRMAQVSAKLQEIPGFPADFIQKQQPAKKRVVSEETIAATYKLGGNALRAVLPLVTVSAVKPATETDVWVCIAQLVKALSADDKAARLALAQALESLVDGDSEVAAAPQGRAE